MPVSLQELMQNVLKQKGKIISIVHVYVSRRTSLIRINNKSTLKPDHIATLTTLSEVKQRNSQQEKIERQKPFHSITPMSTNTSPASRQPAAGSLIAGKQATIARQIPST
jgi:hypothetical protein